MRKFGVTLTAVALCLAIAGQAAAVTASGLDSNQTIRIVGGRFIIHTHVAGVNYDGTKHTVNGTVGMKNTAERARNVNCDVAAIFHSERGQATRKRRDHYRTHVGPHSFRSQDYSIQLRDPSGRFRNMPTNVTTHCHTPSRR